jgi:hypothetical protein
MKVYGSRCIDPHFIDLGTSWRWVVNFTPRPLYLRGKPVASRYTDYAIPAHNNMVDVQTSKVGEELEPFHIGF